MDQNSLSTLVQSSDFDTQIFNTDLFGVTVASVQINVTGSSIILFGLLWYLLGLFDMAPWGYWYFVFYVILSIYNIFADATTTDTSVELAYSDLQDALVKMEGILSVMIIVYIGTFFLDIPPGTKSKALTLLTFAVVSMAFALITMSTPNSSNYIHLTRVFKQTFANHAIVLFMYALTIILVKA
jgi:zona occludens toxin (predicted ATPase)